MTNGLRLAVRTSLFATGFLLGTPGLASAQGFALNRFEPAERGSEWFTADSLDLRGHVRPAIGATLDWGYKPLVVSTEDLTEQAALVRHQVFAHLGGTIVMWNRVRFGASLPVALHQSGDDATVNGAPLTAPSGAAVGDLRLGATARLLGEYGDLFTLGFGTWVFLPTGSRTQMTGDGSVRISPHVVGAGDVGPIAYSGRIGPGLRFADARFADATVGTQLDFALGAGVRALSKKLLVGPELWGSTTVANGAAFDRANTPVELGLGAHYTHGSVRFGLGGSTGLTYGYGTPQARGLASIEWAPPFEVPPPPPVDTDSDGDGVLDREDACVTVPGVRDPDPKKNGCPADRDGDGILDTADACIDVPGVANEDPKKNGCPPERAPVPTDRDGDGVFDAEDACPDVAGIRTTDPKTNGCPLVAVVGKEIKIAEQVKFGYDSAVIEKDSAELLATIAKTLTDNPQIAKVRVEGHTDNYGTEQYNVTLSQQRADAVVEGLVKLGIDKSRLRAEGFGRSRPLDKNDTEVGRANNRRVEFHIEDAPSTPAAK